MALQENLAGIRSRMEEACRRAGRNPASASLLCVSKHQSPESIQELLSLGQCAFGENRAQELLEKASSLHSFSLEWHFIGRLQSNKVRKLLPIVSLFHSLDSEKLAGRLNDAAGALGKKARVLVQVNIAREETKQGLEKEEVRGFLGSMGRLQHIAVEGLMCYPPEREAGSLRHYFAEMRSLFDSLKNLESPTWSPRTLSMGSSNDFEVAVEEGSTLVRVGRALFR